MSRLSIHLALGVLVLVALAIPIAAQEGVELAPSFDPAVFDSPIMSTAQAEEIEPCVAEDDRGLAALKGGRFHVYACWRAPDGSSGTARILLVTRESGFFYFFGQDNVEVMVKVIDACIDPYNRFWFFASGLTNLEVTITVTDRRTERSMTYRNPLGQAFQPIFDTSSFDTCP